MRPRLARGGLAPVEVAFRAATRTREVTGVKSFLLSVHPYHGPAVTLQDGTVVRRGALIGELHFWNQQIARGYAGMSAREVLWNLMRDLEADLGRLAAHAATDLPAELVAFYAVTPLAPIAPRLGFTYVPLAPSPALRLLSAWQRMLGRVFRPAGRPRARRDHLAGACWLTRPELQERFGARTHDA